MANYYKSLGLKVMIGAADTFRAAAIDQLEIWAVTQLLFLTIL